MSGAAFEAAKVIVEYLNAIAAAAVSEEEIPDLAGDLNFIRSKAQELSLNLRSEAAPYAQGDRYKLVPNPETIRSYNLSGIIKRRMDIDPDYGVENVLAEMVVNGVFGPIVWTKLKAWADAFGMTLTVAHREVADGDTEADVGETKRERPYKIESVREVGA